jgi:hypothetical protein
MYTNMICNYLNKLKIDKHTDKQIPRICCYSIANGKYE